MSSRVVDVPAALPVLSAGKHRSPRKGACFMEFASFLAGEKWSDHPACTQPLLARLARLVNDCTSDEQRPRLAQLIPSVIGLRSDDPRLDIRIALRAASTALPVAAVSSQRVLAVAILSGRRVLVQLDGQVPADIEARTELALEAAPDAVHWAHEFSAGASTTVRGYLRSACPTAVRCAVEGVLRAAVSQPDARLHDLLAGAIEESVVYLNAETPAAEMADAVDRSAWLRACRITGVARPSAWS